MEEGKQENHDLGFSATSFSSSFFLPLSISLIYLCPSFSLSLSLRISQESQPWKKENKRIMIRVFCLCGCGKFLWVFIKLPLSLLGVWLFA
jgi:hypothetical protein